MKCPIFVFNDLSSASSENPINYLANMIHQKVGTVNMSGMLIILREELNIYQREISVDSNGSVQLTPLYINI